MSTRNSSLCATSYSHLLYLSDVDRDSVLSGTPSPRLRRQSTSYFSMTSTRCSSDSERSYLSFNTCPSSNPSSLYSAKILTPRYADDHYPLLSTLGHSQPSPQTSCGYNLICVAKEIACINNAFIRAINSAYNHAPAIGASTKRAEDFLLYNQILYKMLNRHFKVEDNITFPSLERLNGCPGSANSYSNARETFLNPFFVFGAYILDPKTVETFDGSDFRKHIESFAPELIQYLHNEITMIVNLPPAYSKELRKMWVQAQKSFIDDIDLSLDGPLMLGCHDKSFFIDGEKEHFPGIPWVVETLVRNWYSKKNVGVWEFCPSDSYGNRRLLNC